MVYILYCLFNFSVCIITALGAMQDVCNDNAFQVTVKIPKYFVIIAA